MTSETTIQPWERIRELMDAASTQQLNTYVDSLNAQDLVHAMSHLKRREQMELLTQLYPANAADVLEEIPEAQAVEIIEDLKANDAAAIFTEMVSDDRVDIITEMEAEEADAILAELSPDEADAIRELVSYDDESAGGLMVTELLSFRDDQTIRAVTEHLRQKSGDYEEYHIKYLHVLDDVDRLKGIVRMRDLIMLDPDTALIDVATTDLMTVNTLTPLDELADFFETWDYYQVPVVDEYQHLVGIVLRKDVLEALNERTSFEHLESQGIVGGDELRTMPVLLRSRRRLSWLSVNVLLNIIAASVIAYHQDVIESVIAMAVFLPIISDMSGCTGNQAVAVSMRELSLGVVRSNEALRVWFQEITVGLINGTVLGLLIGGAAWLWKGNVYLGLVVGGALAVNTLIAVSIGGSVPLLLKHFGIDPALASGPILTTITDMCGFFFALTFASLALSQLGGM